ncbi:diguanylate cyclase [Candidatus Bipolaricaulota bacterium]|nr:diguanylate cyclase [Candidatus Bipolaricaulota bacterium]
MSLELTVECLALFATAAISLVVAHLIRSKKRISGVTELLALMIAVAGWALVAGLEATVVAFRLKLLFSTLEYVGSGATMALLLRFAVQHAGKGAWLTRNRKALLWLLPALNVALVATNGWHGLVWSGFSPASAESHLLIYEHGAGFYAILGGIYLYIAAATLLLLYTALRTSVIPRRQAIAILITIPIPWAASLLYAVSPGVINGLNIIPMAFFFVGCSLVLSITRWRVFDLAPIARDMLVERMEDAFVVIDAQQSIVDYNRAATRMLGIGLEQIGRRAELLLPFWSELVEIAGDRERACCTPLRMGDGVPRHASVQLTSVENKDGIPLGALVMVHDVTQRHQVELALRESNEALQRKLVENEQLQRELREQALRDPLTGLHNRRFLEDILPVEIRCAEEEGGSVSLVVVDIDRFKTVNDVHGHARGDAMLTALGNLIRNKLRGPQSAGRYGGDEFMVILPQAPLNEAVAWADSLRRLFEPIAAAYNGSIRAATLSAGVAAYPEHGSTGADLFHVADVALYKAKNAGRNCVCVGSPQMSLDDRSIGSDERSRGLGSG